MEMEVKMDERWRKDGGQIIKTKLIPLGFSGH